MTWQDVTPYILNLLSITGGFLAGRILQRETRHYDRETKRLQYVKAFYEVQNLSRPSVNGEFDKRAEDLIKQSQTWFERRPREADLFAKSWSWFPAVIALILLSSYLGRFLNWYFAVAPQPPHTNNDTARTLLLVGRGIDVVLTAFFAAFILREIWYWILVKWVVRWYTTKHPSSWLTQFRF